MEVRERDSQAGQLAGEDQEMESVELETESSFVRSPIV